MRRLRGKGYPGPNYIPEGYLIERVGPTYFENSGIAEVEASRDKLINSGRGGCPFH